MILKLQKLLTNIKENLLYDQRFFITKFLIFLEKIFSKYQTGFRQGFSLQNCLVAMIEKLEFSLDKGGEYAALLTCLKHLIVYHRI